MVERSKAWRHARRSSLAFAVASGVGFVACVGTDPAGTTAPSSDAGTADAITTDAASADAAASACDLDAPFGPPVPVEGVNSEHDDMAARLSADELTIFFGREDPIDGGASAREIYVASRKTRTDAFGSPGLLAELLADFGNSAPMLTPDGLTLYFESTQPTSVKHDIWFTTRRQGEPLFPSPNRIPNLDNDSDERTPFFSVADNALWFGSNRHAPGSNYKIFRAPLNAAAFDPPEPVEEFSTDESEWYPVLSSDALTIYWGSNRKDSGAQGAYDVWRARRETTADKFGAPENVTELNSAEDELPTWLSPDGCRIYLQRSTPTERTNIYFAEKPPR